MKPAKRINGWLRHIPVWSLYVILPIPGAIAFWLAISGQAGPNPVQALEHEYGELALRLIILTLLVTPLRQWTGVSLLKFRRALGLMAFFYVVAHLSVWLILDRQLVLLDIWKEIVKRPYITLGMLGFASMVPLAITSNDLSIRRLGAELWTKIHRLAYLAAAAGAAHYLLLVKAWPPEPIVYALVVASLLAVRAWWSVKRRAARLARRSCDG